MSFFHKLFGLKSQKPKIVEKKADAEVERKAEAARHYSACLAAITAQDDAAFLANVRLLRNAALPSRGEWSGLIKSLIKACNRPAQIDLLYTLSPKSRQIWQISIYVFRTSFVSTLTDESALIAAVSLWSTSGFISFDLVGGVDTVGGCCLAHAIRCGWPAATHVILGVPVACRKNMLQLAATRYAQDVAANRRKVLEMMLGRVDDPEPLSLVLHAGACDVVLERLPFYTTAQAAQFVKLVVVAGGAPQTREAVACFDTALAISKLEISRETFAAALEYGNVAVAVRLAQLGAVGFPHTACRAILSAMTYHRTGWNWLPTLKLLHPGRILNVSYLLDDLVTEFCEQEAADALAVMYDFRHGTGFTATSSISPSARADIYVRCALHWKLKVAPDMQGLLTERVRLMARVVLRGLSSIGQPNVSVTFITRLIAGWI